ncbi:hypothetical protein FRC02_011350 [Tulasnella sp. 418]|nr:hypothetical protein FRC02_011350 [Tulasnella sp. 418]
MKVSLIIPTVLAAHGYRKQSLSLSGSITAFIVGVLTFSAPLKTFGITMIVFYLVCSRATKVGKSIKEKLEDGHHEAGRRDGYQVLSNSLAAVIATSIWAACFTSSSLHATIVTFLFGNNYTGWNQSVPDFDGYEWCAVDPIVAKGWSRALVLTALGQFACCCGDTLASELGILSKSPPVLITNFKRVPPGTNGGLSAMGTAASVLGGTIVGLTMAVALIFENTACVAMLPSLGKLILLGAFAGGLGSLVCFHSDYE